MAQGQRRGLMIGIIVVVVAVLIAGGAIIATRSSSSSTNSGPWTIKVASQTTATPNWIFPYMSGAYFSVSNINDFINLMTRPLYWFGTNGTTSLNTSESLAQTPVYSNGDKTVSVTLKSGLTWSNGKPIQAKDVMYWMNALAAYPSAWADYIPPNKVTHQLMGIPDNVHKITVSGSTITFDLNVKVNPQWFTYNDLSQITPMPQAWDVMQASGPTPSTSTVGKAGGNFATKTAGCWSSTWIGDGNTGPSSAVMDPNGDNTVVPVANKAAAANCVAAIKTMVSFSSDNADYANKSTDTGKLFSINDGPWTLKSYNVGTGSITFVPNKTYAGPIKPTATEVQYVPCTSDLNCYNLVQTGTVTQGTVPLIYAPKITSLSQAGSVNPVASKGYSLAPVYSWVINYFPYNFKSTLGANGHAAAVFSQLYFRKAFQSIVNQTAWINSYQNGYGYPTYGPVPTQPPNSLTSLKGNPYPYMPTKAAALLTANGWKVVPNGTTTCTDPTKCGAGIPAGTPLSFNLVYASGTTSLDHSMSSLKSSAALVGIQLALQSQTFNAVIGTAFGGTTNWDLANWGGGWLFAPDYYPTGESLFATGSGSNAGLYTSSTADALIAASIQANVSLKSYEAYIATQVPVVWQPNAVGLSATKSNITGINRTPLQTFTPESWRQ